MSYPLSFRERVFAVKEELKLTFEETSKRFKVGIASLFRWQKEIEPKITRNKPATKIDMEKLKEDVVKNPDNYQKERAVRFGVTNWAIGAALKRLKITLKKNSETSQSGRRKAYHLPEEDRTVRKRKSSHRVH